MRLFVGIELDAGLASAIDDGLVPLRSRLTDACPGLSVRWVPRDNLHLTLVFIGMVDEERCDAIITALEPPFPDRSFDVTIGGLGVFPPFGPPAVIWLGIPPCAAPLTALQQAVAERLAAVGVHPEKRPYVPHLTVARIKGAAGAAARAARKALRDQVTTPVVVRVSAVTLFRSHPAAQGSAYQALKRLPLLG